MSYKVGGKNSSHEGEHEDQPSVTQGEYPSQMGRYSTCEKRVMLNTSTQSSTWSAVLAFSLTWS
jgi:hypothetical protein